MDRFYRAQRARFKARQRARTLEKVCTGAAHTLLVITGLAMAGFVRYFAGVI